MQAEKERGGTAEGKRERKKGRKSGTEGREREVKREIEMYKERRVIKGEDGEAKDE